jgi:very-short-patch-repair endonuclease
VLPLRDSEYNENIRNTDPLADSILEIAAHRHGVVRTNELRAGGLSQTGQARRTEDGTLRHVRYGLVCVTDLATPFTEIAAAQLRYPDLVAERRTAAAIWKLDGFAPGPVDLVRSIGARHRSLELPRLRAHHLPEGAVTTRLGLRVTTPTWTVAELECAGADTDLVELALESVLRRRPADEAYLRKAKRPVLQAALARRKPGAPATESYAETRFLQKIVRPLGLEDPERQVPIVTRGRTWPYRCDFLFRRAGILDVEVDGSAAHTGDAHDHDILRDHRLRDDGCAVLRVSAWRIDRTRSTLKGILLRELAAVS